MNGSFQSTPSVRRATDIASPTDFLSAISIHALREESDMLTEPEGLTEQDFNPRPP